MDDSLLAMKDKVRCGTVAERLKLGKLRNIKGGQARGMTLDRDVRMAPAKRGACPSLRMML